MVKVATTIELIQLNNKARKKRLNRIIPKEVIDRLDPEGWQVTTSTTMGQEYFVRVIWMLKMKNKEHPYEAIMDMQYGDYNKLREWDGETRLMDPLERDL